MTRPWVNLGIAVALEDGKGLIVPVIRNAQDLNLLGVARAIADLATRARTKKLLPDDVQGGTFTVTNPGGYGTFHGTPIISQPQVGILGTYALVKRPWVVQDELGQDVIAIRPLMNITLTYDHRLVDGAYAAASCATSASGSRGGSRPTSRLACRHGANLLDAGSSPTARRSSCSARSPPPSSQGEIPETVILVEHPPVVTTGRRTEPRTELHIPDGAEVELVETDRGGKSTYHAPGQLVCYPILDLTRHGKDVRRYVRDLEQAIVETLAAFELEATTIEGLTGRLDAAGRAAGPAEDRVDRRPGLALGDDARLRAQRRPRPGTVHRVDHRLRARRRRVHDDGPRARPAGRGRRGEAGRGGGARRRVRARARGAPAGRRRERSRAVTGAARSAPRQAGTTSGLSVQTR